MKSYTKFMFFVSCISVTMCADETFYHTHLMPIPAIKTEAVVLTEGPKPFEVKDHNNVVRVSYKKRTRSSQYRKLNKRSFFEILAVPVKMILATAAIIGCAVVVLSATFFGIGYLKAFGLSPYSWLML